ncbi:hypothetical protein MOUN0_N01266 [Monosporozyma unispora]|nr:low temperature responsive protein [Kazachstania unispora]
MNHQQIRETCQIATVKPTIENVVPLTIYKKTQPRQLNDSQRMIFPQDQSILFGGGRDFILTLLNSDDESQKLESVDLFILNNCVILWFDVLGHGLQIPYTSILYHAIESNHPHGTPSTLNDGHSLALIITLERDPVLNQFFTHTAQPIDSNMIDSVELVLYPKYSTYERHYNTQVETLFTFTNFGMNRGDDLINNCHDAMAIGMELHLDTFRDEIETEQPAELHQDESHATYTGISDFLQHTTFQNTGLADDLDNDETFLNQVVNNNPTDAGMALQFQLNDKSHGKRGNRD